MTTVAQEQLMERISAATKRASESGDKRDPLVVAGEILLDDVRKQYPSIPQQEKILTKWANITIQAIQDFSDYKECFWEASYFYQLIIENYSAKTVLPTVKACVAVYNTEYSSDKLVTGWATTAMKICAKWIKSEASEDISKPELLQAIKNANSVIYAIVKAGQEFKDIVKSNAELKDVLAELNLLIEQSQVAGSIVCSGTNSAAVAAMKKELVQIEALSCDSAEGVISALETWVDLANPSGAPLFEANNIICEEGPSDLEVQVRASQGPLAKLAVQAVFQQNEGNKGKRNLFLEGLVFCQLLLQPWDRSNAAHMEGKMQIASALQELDIVTALLGQFKFWAVEWEFKFGDCGDPAFLAFLELARYFPDIIKDRVLPDEDVVTLIRRVSANHTYNFNLPGSAQIRGTGGDAAVVLEALLDGLPEPDFAAQPFPRWRNEP